MELVRCESWKQCDGQCPQDHHLPHLKSATCDNYCNIIKSHPACTVEAVSEDE